MYLLKTRCITKDFWLIRSLNTLYGISLFSKKFGINSSIPIAMWFPVPVPGLCYHYAGKEQGGYSLLKPLLSLKSFWQLFRVYTLAGLSQVSSPGWPWGTSTPLPSSRRNIDSSDWCRWCLITSNKSSPALLPTPECWSKTCSGPWASDTRTPSPCTLRSF